MNVENHDTLMADQSSSPLLSPPEPAARPWEQTGEYDPAVEHQISLARASRDQAETTRQRIAAEILEAAKEKCQQLLSSGNSALQDARKLQSEAQAKHSDAQAELKRAENIRADAEAAANNARETAKRLETEAETKRTEAQAELKRAESIRADAEADRERILAESRRQARELLDTARLEAERERTDLKHQATLEAQRILAQARAMRDAAREELEAQRIYADAAKLKAWSHDILGQLGAEFDRPQAASEQNGNRTGFPAQVGREADAVGQAPAISHAPPLVADPAQGYSDLETI